MRRAKPSMKNAKPQIGKIKFGKATPEKTKYMKWNIEYDKKAEELLFRSGMVLLKKDKPAVIEYAIKKALEYYARNHNS
jgi:hypothetical protein